jgi:hypothetical protein
MKIRPKAVELYHGDGQTDRHDEARGRFSQFLRKPLKKTAIEELITSNKHYKPTVHKRPYSTHLYYVLGATC